MSRRVRDRPRVAPPRPRPMSLAVLVAALPAVLAGLPGCAGLPVVPGPPADHPPVLTTPATVPAEPLRDGRVTPSPAQAAAVLATLPVKGRAAQTGYARARFGTAWTDVDGDGCDQRNQVLARDLTSEVFKRGGRGCVVLSGRLHDPYTGRDIAFRRGNKTSEAVQIDHVVALANAWQTGAGRLDQPTLVRLANDPLNLLAVDGPTNQSKGHSDAATWLPPSKAFRCAYVSRQVAVKQRYRLWVTPAERAAMERVLSTCIAQPIVTR